MLTFLVSNAYIPASWACETAELKRNTGWRRIGLHDLSSNLVISKFYMYYLLTPKIIFSPLHIKLGLLKQFIKALPTECNCFKSIISGISGPLNWRRQFQVHHFSISCRLKQNQRRSILWSRDSASQQRWTIHLNNVRTWKNASKTSSKTLLGYKKPKYYIEIIQELLESLETLGFNMSIKLARWEFSNCTTIL